MSFSVVAATNRQELDELLPEWLELLETATVGATVENDPRYLRALLVAAPVLEPVVIVVRDSGRLRAVAAFLRRTTRFKLNFSVLQIPLLPTRILESCGSRFVTAADSDPMRFVDAVFRWLEQRRDLFDLLAFPSLSPDSAIWRYGKGPNAALPLRPMTRNMDKRHFVAMEGSFEDYLQSLGIKTRKGVKRMRRQMYGDNDLAVRVEKVVAPDQVASFLDAVDRIYARTWQSKTFGPRNRNTPAIQRSFDMMARDGVLRSYLLYFGERPVAYEIGYQAGGQFFRSETGYDAECKAHRPGVAVLVEALEDLFNDPCIHTYDFGHGDLEQKRNLGNREMDVATVFTANSSFWRAVISLQRLANDLYDSGRSLALKTGIEDFLRRKLKHKS